MNELNDKIMKPIDYLRFEDTRKFLAVFHSVNCIELMQYRFTMCDEWDDENPCEWQNAVCDVVEDINRLEVGQSIPFNPIRGEKTCNGFILRMK